jgi:hypothetical protein
MSAVLRRVIRLQRQILKTIRADVRRALGPQSRELIRYYEAYKREFRTVRSLSSLLSTKDELLAACQASDIILMGDYHTFSQSQKAAIRLLSELTEAETPLVLGLEMIRSEHQAELDRYMAGDTDDASFLKAIDYENTWGFPWANFKPLLDFARAHRLRVLGLNLDNTKLDARDEHAADVIASFTALKPKYKVFVFYGDLHLARGHIPKYLRRALASRGLDRRTLTIFQNSESLYWKLAASREGHSTDVLALKAGGRDRRFCIMSAAPWVKLQSYLEWAEAGALVDLGEDDTAAAPNLHEVAHERLRQLAETLGLEVPEGLDFTIQTVNDLSFLRTSPALGSLTRAEVKALKYHVLGNRSAFIPGPNLIYLASPSVNAIAEGVALLFHANLSKADSVYHDVKEHFYAAVLTSCIAYFGSKVLNHKRKCDLEEDFRALLSQRLPRRALPQERFQRLVARLVVRHCQAQTEYLRTDRYRVPTAPSGPQRMPLFLETARRLGSILGEKLYTGFVEERYSSKKIETLFRADLKDPRKARLLYLDLLSNLSRSRIAHSSKTDLF